MRLNTSQGPCQTLSSLPCTGGSTIQLRTHTRSPGMNDCSGCLAKNLANSLAWRSSRRFRTSARASNIRPKNCPASSAPSCRDTGKQSPQPTGSLPKTSQCGEYPLTAPGKSFKAQRANGKLSTQECLLEPPRCSRYCLREFTILWTARSARPLLCGR